MAWQTLAKETIKPQFPRARCNTTALLYYVVMYHLIIRRRQKLLSVFKVETSTEFALNSCFDEKIIICDEYENSLRDDLNDALQAWSNSIFFYK